MIFHSLKPLSTYLVSNLKDPTEMLCPTLSFKSAKVAEMQNIIVVVFQWDKKGVCLYPGMKGNSCE